MLYQHEPRGRTFFFLFVVVGVPLFIRAIPSITFFQ